MKKYYNNVCQELITNYPGVIISRSNFCGLFGKAWDEAVTSNNITAGFKACGIWPLNPGIIPNAEQLASSIQDKNMFIGHRI